MDCLGVKRILSSGVYGQSIGDDPRTVREIIQVELQILCPVLARSRGSVIEVYRQSKSGRTPPLYKPRRSSKDQHQPRPMELSSLCRVPGIGVYLCRAHIYIRAQGPLVHHFSNIVFVD
jgi:hypothetical protein